jgi:hypothetical protein
LHGHVIYAYQCSISMKYMLKHTTHFLIRFICCWFIAAFTATTLAFLAGRIKFYFKSRDLWPNQVRSAWADEAFSWFAYFLIICTVYFILYDACKLYELNRKKLIMRCALGSTLLLIVFLVPATLYNVKEMFFSLVSVLVFVAPCGALIPVVDLSIQKVLRSRQNN